MLLALAAVLVGLSGQWWVVVTAAALLAFSFRAPGVGTSLMRFLVAALIVGVTLAIAGWVGLELGHLNTVGYIVPSVYVGLLATAAHRARQFEYCEDGLRLKDLQPMPATPGSALFPALQRADDLVRRGHMAAAAGRLSRDYWRWRQERKQTGATSLADRSAWHRRFEYSYLRFMFRFGRLDEVIRVARAAVDVLTRAGEAPAVPLGLWAMAAFRLGKIREARSVLTQDARVLASNAFLQLQAAHLEYHLGFDAESREMNARVLRADPRCAQGLKNRAWYTLEAIAESVRRGKGPSSVLLKSAHRDLVRSTQSGIERFSYVPAACLHAKAVLLVFQGRPLEAMEFFRHAIELQQHPGSRVGIAILYMRRGSFLLARYHLAAAIENTRSNPLNRTYRMAEFAMAWLDVLEEDGRYVPSSMILAWLIGPLHELELARPPAEALRPFEKKSLGLLDASSALLRWGSGRLSHLRSGYRQDVLRINRSA